MTESWKLREQLRALYAKRDDPYVTVDLAIARVLSALFWILGAVIIAILLPFAPPTEEIGWVGWPVAGAMLVACLLVARRRVSENWEPDFVETLIGGSLAFLGLVALEWLAGGRGTP